MMMLYTICLYRYKLTDHVTKLVQFVYACREPATMNAVRKSCITKHVLCLPAHTVYKWNNFTPFQETSLVFVKKWAFRRITVKLPRKQDLQCCAETVNLKQLHEVCVCVKGLDSITCSFPQSLHLSQPTQSIIVLMLRKCSLNSTFNFPIPSFPLNISVSLKWWGNVCIMLSKSFTASRVSQSCTSLPKITHTEIFDRLKIKS